MMPDFPDPRSPLERELADYAPNELPETLRARITAELQYELDDKPLCLADRLLAGATTLGALAAAIILLITLWQLTRPGPPQPTPEEIANRARVSAEYQQLLAAR